MVTYQDNNSRLGKYREDAAIYQCDYEGVLCSAVHSVQRLEVF
jgi:hypothetical protein